VGMHITEPDEAFLMQRDPGATLGCLRAYHLCHGLLSVYFKRFTTAAHFIAFLGLVPREHSSGTRRLQGGITKTGNTSKEW